MTYRCLVTGGAGFIGSHLVDALLAQGHTVTVLDNFSTGREVNLTPHPNLTIISGDILDTPQVNKIVPGHDFIFHYAARISVPESINQPKETEITNVLGTLNILEASRIAKTKRIIFVSSSAVYGNTSADIQSEDLLPLPTSPYGLSKLSGEHYCRMYSTLHGLDTICFRYFNVFGPRQSPDSSYAAAIPKFLNLMTQNQAPVIFGDGEQTRDFTYVDNIVHANLLAMTASETHGDYINIACGKSITLNHLIQTINTELKTTLTPRYEASRTGDIRHSRASIDKAHLLIGYSPQVSVEEGVHRTIIWLQSQNV